MGLVGLGQVPLALVEPSLALAAINAAPKDTLVVAITRVDAVPVGKVARLQGMPVIVANRIKPD
ncbi:hypothetical protein SCLCIDRAFT_1225041 [Scleroderma citrinum Foug A]|uniref:Uncharacterized protein n=1 Tax=Scleroderma citrinum Foug A TaxID=1036808 RepID=A0A0C3CQK6_9AGAM|nr:hypothetical protein SCLCIDRAFT_1225041 [Scleroderma citrinum Foug A]